MNLRLVLTHHWYDEIASRRKRIEYRRITAYWRKRILDKINKLKEVTFSRGYTSTTIKFKIVRIDIGSCPYEGWRGEYIRIWFDDISRTHEHKG